MAGGRYNTSGVRQTQMYSSTWGIWPIFCNKCKRKVIFKNCIKKTKTTLNGAFLLVQWLGIHLLMQGTRVPSLVWEDSTCQGATKPVSHDYRSPHNLEPVLHSKKSHLSKEPVHRDWSSSCSPQLEKVRSNTGPVRPKNK